jgi:hypothetical protein
MLGSPAWGIPYGLTGILPVWDGPAPSDGVGVRFKFFVAENESQHLKLIFGSSRVRGTGADTYLMEYNLYDRGLRYEDGVTTTWPLQGSYAYQQSSLRVAVPDYILKGKTGARTFNPEMFPRQTYEIDGIDGLWKTDLMTQTDMNQIEGSVALTRGDLVTELTGWRTDGADLPLDTYRQWNVAVSFGQETYNMAFAFPDASAQYLASWQPMTFYSEFLQSAGLFRVNYWDFGIKREGTGEWESMNTWRVSHHDGSLDDFGVALASHDGNPVIEIGNDPASTYLHVDTIIDITPIPEPAAFYIFVTGAFAVFGIAARRKLQIQKV